MKRKKSWREKLEYSKNLPRVERIPEAMSTRWGEGTIVIPAPMEVDEIMSRVPRGKLITMNRIREILARKHGATIGCPITCGIFARIAAEVAAEDEAEGKRSVTPFWRTLKAGGELNSKYPGGIEGQKGRLEAEGHRILTRGRRSFVADYGAKLMNIDD